MEYADAVMQSMSNIESIYLKEASRLAEILADTNINYDELIELQRYTATKSFDNMNKELFDRIKEKLLILKLE